MEIHIYISKKQQQVQYANINMILKNIKIYIYFLTINVLSATTLRRVPRSSSIVDNENYLIKKSYDEITALVDKHFNPKCNLLLQNCIFQNQWERLFGHDKVFFDEKNKKRSIKTKTSFYYCQAFIVARFCIDDYLTKTYNDNYECLNGTNGNLPAQFKHTIHRNECKKYYSHFFISNSFSNRNLYSSSNAAAADKLNSYFSSRYIKFYSFFKIILLIVFVF